MLKSYSIYIAIYSISLILLIVGVIIERKVRNSKETKFTKWWRNHIVGNDPYEN
jgi:hypothetical protein